MLTYSKYPGLSYDPAKGHFWKMKYQGADLVLDRRLIAVDEFIGYFCPVQRKPVRKKAARVAWEIVNRIPSDGLLLVHRNLDPSDFRASNLCAIGKDDQKNYKDALLNVSGAVKLKASPTDAFTYVVTYRKASKVVNKRCQDIVTALRLKKRILLLSMKELGKYISSS